MNNNFMPTSINYGLSFAQLCVYTDMINLFQNYPPGILKNFINCDDKIQFSRDESEYDNNVVVVYNSLDSGQRGLFCFNPEEPLRGDQFYELLCSNMQRVYVEYLI